METTNYAIFKIVDTNRQLSEPHIETLIKSIKKYGFFKSKPITINQFFQVSDGQHRLEAAKRLNIPVHYEIDNIDVDESMIVLNNTSNNWRLNEFINHYAAKGYSSYIELQNFYKNYSTEFIGVSNIVSIFCGSPRSMSKEIRNGKELKKNDNLDLTIDLIRFFKPIFEHTLSANFIRSLITFLNTENINLKDVEKLKKNAYSIIPCATTDQYYNQFLKLIKKK